MTDPEIRDLIVRSRRGDDYSFERLVRAHQAYAFALALRLLCDESEARDAVQESFIQVWRHLNHYDPSQKFTTWLYTIVTNRCMDRLRSLKRRLKIFAAGQTGDDISELPDPTSLENTFSNGELTALIRKLTHGLSPKQKLVFTLRDLEDCSIEETGEITGMSAETIKANLHYARRKIREMVMRYDNREM
jgi:RNA polymerase sigma-70 factor (ECF subfamily)